MCSPSSRRRRVRRTTEPDAQARNGGRSRIGARATARDRHPSRTLGLRAFHESWRSVTLWGDDCVPLRPGLRWTLLKHHIAGKFKVVRPFLVAVLFFLLLIAPTFRAETLSTFHVGISAREATHMGGPRRGRSSRKAGGSQRTPRPGSGMASCWRLWRYTESTRPRGRSRARPPA